MLASMDVRRHVRNLLIRNDLDVPVLSYQELATEFSVQPLATIAGEPEKDAIEGGTRPRSEEPVTADARQFVSHTAAGRTAVETVDGRTS